MKKLLLVCCASTLVSINAINGDLWSGAPQALRTAAQSPQVMEAMEQVGSSVAHLMQLYAEKLAPSLTDAQKKQCAAILLHAKKMLQKSYELSQKGGNDQKLQEEIQAMGQELFFSYFPLLLTIQQEVTDQMAEQIEGEMKTIAGKGYDMLDNAVDAMIKVLQ